MSQQEKRILIISGTSRPKGNTSAVMSELSSKLQATLLQLTDYQIGYYDYEHRNQSDDFMSLAEKMTMADVIILGTPVYWYSLSAQLKTFIDRWSDLLTIRKDLGRALKGKSLILVSCGSWEEPGQGFELPIVQTAAYMHMEFAGYFHTWITDQEDSEGESVKKRVASLFHEIRKIVDAA